METVEVVIRIPKEQYEYICHGQKTFTTELCLLNGVCDGILLPKGHTDLIDRQALIHSIKQKAKRLSNLDTINGLCGAVALIYEANAVIDADKDGENKE